MPFKKLFVLLFLVISIPGQEPKQSPEEILAEKFNEEVLGEYIRDHKDYDRPWWIYDTPKNNKDYDSLKKMATIVMEDIVKIIGISSPIMLDGQSIKASCKLKFFFIEDGRICRISLKDGEYYFEPFLPVSTKDTIIVCFSKAQMTDEQGFLSVNANLTSKMVIIPQVKINRLLLAAEAYREILYLWLVMNYGDKYCKEILYSLSWTQEISMLNMAVEEFANLLKKEWPGNIEFLNPKDYVSTGITYKKLQKIDKIFNMEEVHIDVSYRIVKTYIFAITMACNVKNQYYLSSNSIDNPYIRIVNWLKEPWKQEHY